MIVRDIQASPAERHAAEELASVLGQVTGAVFPVVGESADDVPRILIGPDAARLADPGFSIADLGTDGFVIRTVGQDLILAGGRPRGTLYAVYTFLETIIGCRWWTPHVSYTPRIPELRLDALNIRQLPQLEYRVVFWYPGLDDDWAVRNKTHGGIHPPLAEHRGGSFLHSIFCHTFFSLIPPATYFDDHPEWFSMINGTRVRDKQICLTDKDLLEAVKQRVRAQLKDRPNIDYFWVSQNDWGGPCQCEACAAVDAEEGSPAGTLLRFVNAVAEDIADDYPDVKVATLAYQYTRKAPRITRARDNVAVWLCFIEANYAEPLTHPDNAPSYRDLQAWREMASTLYVWEYTVNFWDFNYPHPNWFTIGSNANLYAKHAIDGVFAQGAGSAMTPDMAELRAWVLAKLLWDPSRDGDALIREFLDGYYGAAGSHLYRYMETLSTEAKARRFYASYKYDVTGNRWTYGPLTQVRSSLISYQALYEAWHQLKEAEAAVAGDAERLARVLHAQRPLMHVFRWRWEALREAVTDENPWPMPESVKALQSAIRDIRPPHQDARFPERGRE